MSFNPLPESLRTAEYESSKQFLDAKANAILAEQGQEGLAGFLFDISTQESVRHTAEVTDHFTEDNSFFQDHRIIKPVQITISGFIGELAFKGGGDVSKTLRSIGNKLSSVNAYLGDSTPQAVQLAQGVVTKVTSAAASVENALGKAQGLVNAFEGEEVQPTKQQVAYNQLYSLFKLSSLLTLQTPWNFFENLMITELSFMQGAESADKSDVTITLKEIRTSKVKFVEFDLDNPEANRYQIQAAEKLNGGNIVGDSSSKRKSLFATMTDSLTGLGGF